MSNTQSFPHAHLWMLVLFFVVMLGFGFSYWLRILEAPYHQHVHGLTATAWFILLVYQPWLIRKNNIRCHRKWGFFGLFLAGGVVFSALQIVPQNIVNENLSETLGYGLSYADFLLSAGFSASVIWAMVHSKNTARHARFMIASGFWALMPALARLVYIPLAINFNPPPLTFIQVVHGCNAGIVLLMACLLVIDYRREKRLYMACLMVAVTLIVISLTLVPMGNAEWWQQLCDRMVL